MKTSEEIFDDFKSRIEDKNKEYQEGYLQGVQDAIDKLKSNSILGFTDESE